MVGTKTWKDNWCAVYTFETINGQEKRWWLGSNYVRAGVVRFHNPIVKVSMLPELSSQTQPEGSRNQGFELYTFTKSLSEDVILGQLINAHFEEMIGTCRTCWKTLARLGSLKKAFTSVREIPSVPFEQQQLRQIFVFLFLTTHPRQWFLAQWRRWHQKPEKSEL